MKNLSSFLETKIRLATEQTSTIHNFSSVAEVTVLKDRIPNGSKMAKIHILKPYFESLIYASAFLRYALEEELKLELFEAILINILD